MKKRTAMMLAVVGVVVLAAVPLVYAQGMHMRHHGAQMEGGPGFGFMFGRAGRVKEALGLSDAQVDQLKTIGKALRDQNAPYRQQMRGSMQQVAQILLADPNNIAGAQAILDQQAAAQKAMHANMLGAASKALSVLTPEQRGKASTFVAEHAARER